MRRFEELRVWKDARLLVKDIYTITEPLKDWSFKDQIRRAAVSVMNNIAEGSESGTDANYLMEDLFTPEHETILSLQDSTERISSNIYNLINYLNKNTK